MYGLLGPLCPDQMDWNLTTGPEGETVDAYTYIHTSGHGVKEYCGPFFRIFSTRFGKEWQILWEIDLVRSSKAYASWEMRNMGLGVRLFFWVGGSIFWYGHF